MSHLSSRPHHALSRVSSRLSSHVSCHIHHIHRHASGHVFGHVLCHVCRNNSGHVSRHDFHLIFHHVSRRASRHDCAACPVASFLEILSRASSPLASGFWSRLLSRPSSRLFSNVSCHICHPVSGNLSRHDPRHASCRISRHVSRHGSPLLTSIVTPLVTISKCEQRHSESDSTHPKREEGSLCVLKRCTAPQREQFNPLKAQRGFTCNLQMCTAPQRERLDPSAAPATEPARKLERAAPATKSARKALKWCACREICRNSSKVLRLSRKIKSRYNAQNVAPATKPEFDTLASHAEKPARDCSARMISTNFDMLQSRQKEPIVQQGQRNRRRRTHYHAPAKQDTSKRPPLDRRSHWHGNGNTPPSKTLRLRNETTRRA